MDSSDDQGIAARVVEKSPVKKNSRGKVSIIKYNYTYYSY